MQDMINTQERNTDEAKNQKPLNLQDLFLNAVRRDKSSITVYLVNGFQIKGYVKGFDNYVILIESENKTNMIYKHAVSTILPSTAIKLFN